MQISKFKTIDETKCIALITAALVEVSVMIPNELNDAQLRMMAMMTVNNFWHMKIKDILLAMNRGLSGKYGKNYGKFTYTMLSEWINAYDLEKVSYNVQRNLEMKNQIDSTIDLDIDYSKFSIEEYSKKDKKPEPYSKAITLTEKELIELGTLKPKEK